MTGASHQVPFFPTLLLSMRPTVSKHPIIIAAQAPSPHLKIIRDHPSTSCEDVNLILVTPNVTAANSDLNFFSVYVDLL